MSITYTIKPITNNCQLIRASVNGHHISGTYFPSEGQLVLHDWYLLDRSTADTAYKYLCDALQAL